MKPLVYKKSRRERVQVVVRHKLHIAKGDTVRVISGEHRGKEGRVLHVYPKKFRVVVEGVNVVKKHKRATTPQGESGIIEFAAPIAASNVMLLDPKSRAPAPGQGREAGADRGQIRPADPTSEVVWQTKKRNKKNTRSSPSRRSSRSRTSRPKRRSLRRRSSPRPRLLPPSRSSPRRGHGCGISTSSRCGASCSSGLPSRTRIRFRGSRRTCSTSGWATPPRIPRAWTRRSPSWLPSPASIRW